MKKLLLLATALLCLHFFSQAQCQKEVAWTSSKTEFLDGSQNVQDTKPDNVVMTVTKTNVKILPNQNEDDAMSGTIKSVTCDWKEPYKNGSMIIQSELSDAHGDVKNATITISAKDGKITILLEAKEFPDRKLRLTVDKYEEKES